MPIGTFNTFASGTSGTTSSSPTTTPLGTLSTGATPFIRENYLTYATSHLRPRTAANLFFDQIKVNNFNQRAVPVYVDYVPYTWLNLSIGEGIIAANSYSYGEVIGKSREKGSDLIYLDTNFLTIYVKSTGTAFTSTSYAVDDIVYQTPDGLGYKWVNGAQNYTFYGKVKYWKRINDGEGVLVVDPNEGRANTFLDSGNGPCYIRCEKYAYYSNATNLLANNEFQRGELLYLSANGTNYSNVATNIKIANSTIALSGVVPTVNGSNLNTIVISSNNIIRDGLSDIASNNIYIVSGTNQGFFSKILSVNDFKYGTDVYYKELLLQNSLPTVCHSNTVYSLGEPITDDRGVLAGIFHVPSYSSIKWPAGQRIFTITDGATFDGDSKMKAAAPFIASPVVDSADNARNPVLNQQTGSPTQSAPATTQIQGTYLVNDRKYMSQTFFTPKKSEIVNGVLNTNYGIFVSSVDLFFYSKPTTDGELLPFSLAITRVANGMPVDDVIAECTLHQESINVSSYYDSTQTLQPGVPSSANVSTMTKFTFKDPVYLQPETEYAIRLHSESADYQVWTAQIGSLVADANGVDRRVSQQPYVGSFFKAQNASNWNPIENQDLMFNVNRASFNTTSTFYMQVDPLSLKSNVLADMIKLSSTDQNFTPTSTKYEVLSVLTDGTAVDYVTVNNSEVYDFGKDINISSTSSKRRRLIRMNQGSDVTVRVTMQSSDDSVAPMINKERAGLFAIQSVINNAGIANNLISMSSKGSGYSVSNTVNVTISAPDDPYGTQATADVPASLLGSNGEIQAINITNPGSGYYSTPTITIATGAADTFGVGQGATAVINGETDQSGGNIYAKYQTKIVSLEDGFDSGDLIVRLDAFRPAGTDIQVYFKVLSAQDADTFTDKKWKRMTKSKDSYSATMKDKVYLEYKYNVDTGYIQYLEDGNSYPLGGKFKFFAVKIRLVAADPSVTPSVDTLKILAVPGG